MVMRVDFRRPAPYGQKGRAPSYDWLSGVYGNGEVGQQESRLLGRVVHGRNTVGWLSVYRLTWPSFPTHFPFFSLLAVNCRTDILFVLIPVCMSR